MWKTLLVAGLVLCLAGCDLTDEDSHTLKIEVASHQVTCTGITQQRCYQVRFVDGAPWQLYYGDIKGLDYQPGFQYWLEVRQQQAVQDNPEHSRLAWEVVKEISRTPVAATSADAADTLPASAPVAVPVAPANTTAPVVAPAPENAAPVGAQPQVAPVTNSGANSGAIPAAGTPATPETPAPTDDDIPPD